MKFNLASILTTLLVIALAQSACHGLERTASDYLIPLFRKENFDPTSIKRDAPWFEQIFEKTSGQKPVDIRIYLLALRDKLKATFQPISNKSDLEFAVLINEDFKESASSVEVDGRSRVIMKFIDSIISILDGGHSEFENWLTVTQLFYSLYGIPERNALTVSETGIRFAPKDLDQPQSQLYKYIKYLTESYLAFSLRHMEISVDDAVGDSVIESSLAMNSLNSSLTDRDLWRLAFKGNIREVKSKPQSTLFITDWLSFVENKPEARKSLEKSAGIITLAMALAPEELRKFKGLSFPLMKHVEYLRLLNQNSYTSHPSSFLFEI